MAESPSPRSVCVVGTGGSGILTAALLSLKVERVFCCDLVPPWNDRTHIASEAAEPTASTLVASALNRETLILDGDPGEADSFILAAPEELWSTARSPGDAASVLQPWVERIAPHVSPGATIILQSSGTPPGTTQGPLRGLLTESLAPQDAASMCLGFASQPPFEGFVLYDLVTSPRVIGAREQDREQIAGLYGTFVEGELTLADTSTAEAASSAMLVWTGLMAAAAYEFAEGLARWGVDSQAVFHALRRSGHVAGGKHLRPEGILRCSAVALPGSTGEQLSQGSAAWCAAVREDLASRVLDRCSSILADAVHPKVLLLAADLPFRSWGSRAELVNDLAARIAQRVDGSEVAVIRLPSGRSDRNTYLSAFQDADLLVLLGGQKELAGLSPEEIAPLMRSRTILDPFRLLERGRWMQRGFDWPEEGEAE